MSKASQLLFETPFEGKTLYKRQLDLVTDLIQQHESEYYVDPSKEQDYSKQQIRLKTLISQLLSPHVCRHVPHEFIQSLKIVIGKKVNDPLITDQLVKDIITDLKIKNDLSQKNDAKNQPMVERLKADFKMGSYVAIISGLPLEIESDDYSDDFSLRHLFVQDLLSNLEREEVVLKKYRLLLPLEPSCFLFWKGLKEVLIKFIKRNKSNKTFIRNLKTRFGTLNVVQADLFEPDESLTDTNITYLAESLLTFLNSEGFISVFWHSTPLFSLPVIAINPAETKNARIYAIMRTEKDSTFIHKYATEETMLWRFFVWDRIKTKQFAGKRIDFDVNNFADF